MLLTLLSKRSLNVDFRDAYGFTVRPQHLQRFKQYTNIYKEEEEERSHKWKAFLAQEAPVDTLSSRTRNLDTGDSETVNFEDKKKQFDGEEDNSVKTHHTSDVQTTNEIEAKVVKSDLNEGVEVPPLAKRKVVQTWTEIRSSLGALDYLMSLRVKKNKITNNEHISHSRRASTDENGEDLCLKEMLGNNINANVTESEHFSPWKQELEFLVQGGVPRDLRGEVWQALVGAGARRVEKYYQDLLAPKGHNGDDQKQRVDVPEKWKKQIEKDLPRTFPGHPALDENGRDSLRRILLAYARHNPSVGYCQAINFFAGLLLLMMPEENAFWTLVGIIDDYFDGYFSEEMTESQVDQLVFEELMREKFPKLANHLDYLGVEVTWITTPWFLSLYVNMLPWESVLRVWDVLLFEGNRVMLFRTALAIMELYGPALATTQDAGDVICLLQALISSTFDSSQLALTACMGFNTITEDRLQGLREKHRPTILAMLEERGRGDTKVCKQSKSLATKLASFKRDPGLLMQGSENNEKLASFKLVPRPPMQESEPDDKLASFKVPPRPPIHGSENDKKNSASDSHSANQDDLLNDKTTDSEADSIPELQEQVVWLRIELSKLLEEKRDADRRGEELEAALMEMVKEDNRRELSAKNESLQHENAELRQVLHDKKEQETAMIQVLMRLEEEQRVTEEARIRAEQDAVTQRHETLIFQEKYEKAMASLTEMEKKVVMAESLLEATLQFQSGKSKVSSSPRATASASQPRTGGLLSFGLGWRDWNKGKAGNVAAPDDSKTSHQGLQPGSSESESNGHQESKNSP